MTFEHAAPYLNGGGLCQAPIFVIGSPRSGTTALAQSLGRHPALWVGKESYLLHDLFGGQRIEEMWARHMERVTPCWLAHEKVERDELLAFIGLGVNALFSSRSDGKRWIDPTPLYTPMAETIAAMFPGAVFVHIVRDGRHVVRSMINFERKFSPDMVANAQRNEIPRWSRDFRRGCETWAKWVEAGLDLGDAHPTRCLTVRNEDLSVDPQRGFDAIAGFLRLDPDPAPAAFFGKTRINSSWAKETKRPSDDDWSEWTRSRRKEFVAIAGPTMARAGYDGDRVLGEWVRG
jgi:Sulfotransferase family